jgi:hypothetical protein
MIGKVKRKREIRGERMRKEREREKKERGIEKMSVWYRYV